jgi:hypothetical protein
VLAPAALGAVACARILGVSDYSHAPVVHAELDSDGGELDGARVARGTANTRTDASAAGGTTDSPFSSLACDACLQASCGTERAACDASEACSAFVKSVAGSSDPNVAYGRVVQREDAQWKALSAGQSASDAVGAFTACASENCLDTCRQGRDFACAGAFEWNVPSQPVAQTLRVRILDGITNAVPSPSLDVNVCGQAEIGCAHPLMSGALDARGMVELDVPPQGVPVENLTPFVYAPATAQYPPFIAASTRPITAAEYFAWYPFSTTDVGGWYGHLSVPRGPTDAFVQVWPFDCRALSAKGVTVEAWVVGPEGLRRCTECAVAYEHEYSGGVFLPEFLDTSLSANGDYAYVVQLPTPSRVALVVRRTADLGGDVIGVQMLNVMSGASHYVRIFPYTKTDQSLVDSINRAVQ